MKIYSVEVFNLGTTGCFSGQPVPKGCVGVVVDKCEFKTYHELPGGVFYSECNGLLNIYRHVKGSTDGFAGRTIYLPVMEPCLISKKKQARRVRAFKGSLWDSYEADNIVAKHLGTDLVGISFRAVNSRYQTYSSAKATADFMDRLSKVIILGKPESSPLI